MPPNNFNTLHFGVIFKNINTTEKIQKEVIFTLDFCVFTVRHKCDHEAMISEQSGYSCKAVHTDPNLLISYI